MSTLIASQTDVKVGTMLIISNVWWASDEPILGCLFFAWAFFILVLRPRAVKP